MPPGETDTLLDLVEQNKTIATELPTALAKLTSEREVDPEQIRDVIVAVLSQLVDDGGNAERVTARLPELLATVPELPVHAAAPLTQMATHNNSQIRREGIRCIGFVGAYESMHRDLAAKHATEALTDDKTEIQQAALWSLSKIGLADPDVLTPRRDQLTEFLTVRPQTYGDNETDILRRYAAEALAANSCGSISINDYYPEDASLENPATLAVWAIQHSMTKGSFPVDRDRQIQQTTSIDEDHAVAPQVASALAQIINNGNKEVATGAVLALGYLAPGQSDMHEYIKLLNDILEQDTTESQGLAEAARYVFTRGPFTPAYPELNNPETDKKFDLQSVPVKSKRDVRWTRSDIGVPHEVNSEFFLADDHESFEGTVELIGENSAPARICSLHQEEGSITMTEEMRQTLDIEYGDTVTVRPASTLPARKIVLALPEDAPVEIEALLSTPVRQRLAYQRFAVGDMLSVSLVTDEEQLKKAHRASLDWTLVGDDAKEEYTQCLRLRVDSSFPQSATRITMDTEIVINRTENRTCEFLSEAETPDGKPLTPLSVFGEKRRESETCIDSLAGTGNLDG